MKSRERFLLIVVVVSFLLLCGYLGFTRLVIEPSRRLDRQIAEVSERIKDLHHRNAAADLYRQRIRSVALTTYDANDLQASEKARARLMEMLTSSGLPVANNMSLRPVRGPRVPDVFQEIGWQVRVRGRAVNIVSFLYLLRQDPFLHRLDNLTLTRTADTGELELQMKYATLVLEYPSGERPTTRPADQPLLPIASIEDPQRQQYDMLVNRDLFRPYVRRVVRAQPQSQSPEPPLQPQALPSDPEAGLRVVGLPDWGGEPQVLVRDHNGQTTQYKTGDRLANGRIVAVDYRRMPMPDRPGLFSASRVIIRNRNEYWAIELGQTLADRRRLDTADLPDSLRPPQTSAQNASAGELDVLR